MSLAFHWFLPTYGDSRNLVAGGHGTAMQGDRPASLRYLHQICGAAEDNGFEAVLTPTGLWCEDAWLTTAMLIEGTETLKFLVAFRPRADQSDPGRADGRSLPAALAWTAAAQCRHRR